jgi:hypothetical protein
MQNHPMAISAPSMKTNVSVAGSGSSRRGDDWRDMPARLACWNEGRVKIALRQAQGDEDELVEMSR